MRKLDISKYFTMSNIANMYIPVDLGLPRLHFVGPEEKEGVYRGVKYKITMSGYEIRIEIEFKKKHIDGTIVILFDTYENKFEIIFRIYVPLLGVVDYEDDVYYIAKGYIGTVFEDVSIRGFIERDKLVITEADGEPYIIIDNLRIQHQNFNFGDNYEMCLGTIQTKFPIDALPAMIALIMKTVAMPTSHAWKSDVCEEMGSDVLVNDCILYDDQHGNKIIEKFFIKSKVPPKKVEFKENLEKEFKEYVSQCFDEVYAHNCEDQQDEY